jgi:4-diphosphocytidyl-2-C-methyl-D-erythritol kinase
MVVFPNCKINLGLNITGKRSDGYHDIDTVFFPVPLRDALEIIKVPELSNNTFNESGAAADHPPVSFRTTGIPISGDMADNLCVKAYHLLKKDFPDIPPVLIHLHKVIPSGAGLGGGSSDGASTLCLLNELFQLGLSNEQLIEYAIRLGSDCPFFIINRPCSGKGRGEILTPLDFPVLKGYFVVLVNPGIHIDTRWAFGQINAKGLKSSPMPPAEVLKLPVPEWKEKLTNDFTTPVYKQYPEIRNIEEQLYQLGAEYAVMTGTGSTVYGVFKEKINTEGLFPGYFVSQHSIS